MFSHENNEIRINVTHSKLSGKFISIQYEEREVSRIISKTS